MPRRKFKTTYWEEKIEQAAQALCVNVTARAFLSEYIIRLLEHWEELGLCEEDVNYLENLELP